MKDKKKVVKVGIFQQCIPHYRLGAFRALQKRKDMDFTIYSSEGYKGDDGFLETKHKEKGFHFVHITLWLLDIPFLKKFITFWPYSIWVVITKKCDVVIMPNDFFDLCLWINLILGRIVGCKVCLWGQGGLRRYIRISKRLRRIIMHLASAVIYYSEEVPKRWIDEGFPPAKLFVAYNSLDTHASTAISSQLTESELQCFCRNQKFNGKKLVMFTGRLQYAKKPDILVRAMKQVVARVPSAHAVIIGDGPMRKDLEQLIQAEGLADIVTVTGAIYDEELLAKYFLCSRAAVMPATAGLAIQHAFSYNVPVILGDDMNTHGPEAELVIDHQTGIYCRDGDISDFANAICSLLTDDALHEKLSKNAHEVIEKKYNIDKMAEGFFDAVSYCVRNRKPSVKGTCQ